MECSCFQYRPCTISLFLSLSICVYIYIYTEPAPLLRHLHCPGAVYSRNHDLLLLFLRHWPHLLRTAVFQRPFVGGFLCRVETGRGGAGLGEVLRGGGVGC